MFLFFFYHLVIVSKIIRSFIPSVHFHRRAKQISVSFNTQEPSQTERSCENTQYIPSSSSLLKTTKTKTIISIVKLYHHQSELKSRPKHSKQKQQEWKSHKQQAAASTILRRGKI